MTDDRVTRRLAAIVAADVVGYSRLMAADEAGTLARLKAHREAVVDPTIARFGGRIVKTTGDGMLVTFDSVVDALASSAAIQRRIAERNADEAADRRMDFRVGVHVGDVIVEDDDVHGEGVNLAARLEAIAEPGGITISDRVYADIRGKLDLGFEDLGEQELKNLPEPVRVYRVLLEGAAGETTVRPPRRRRPARLVWAALVLVVAAILGGGAWWWLERQPDFEPADPAKMAFTLPEKPSIAVLPFDNMSGDPEQEYLADGIAENITTTLSQIPDLFVIARNSSFTYKGKPVRV